MRKDIEKIAVEGWFPIPKVHESPNEQFVQLPLYISEPPPEFYQDQEDPAEAPARGVIIIDIYGDNEQNDEKTIVQFNLDD